MRSMTVAVRQQQNTFHVVGSLAKAYEFDYLGARFYIQETDAGYAVLEEHSSTYLPVTGQRRVFILAEFDRARRKQRM